MSADILPRIEWDFDKVPPNELAACCSWEYARESACIREAVKLVKEFDALSGISMSETEFEAFRPKVQEANHLLFETGFAMPFWVRLPFPEPWLSVDVDERKQWWDVRPEIPKLKFPPFQTIGDPFTIGCLSRLADETHKKSGEALRNAARKKAQREVTPNYSELVDTYTHPRPISFLGIGGVQSLAAQISWPDYTNEEIIDAFRKWVKANRPPTVPKPDRRGHKVADLRHDLTCLAAMRLLHHYTAYNLLGANTQRVPHGKRRPKPGYSDQDWVEDVIHGLERSQHTPPLTECSAVWKSKQFAGKQWQYSADTWYEARRDALKTLHQLFPFLPKDEMPCHWQTKGDRTKSAK